MPNTLPPVTGPDQLKTYEQQIREAAPGFTPLMTFKILEAMAPGDVAALHDAGAVSGKLYPAGVTTNASDGVRDWKRCREIFREMEKRGLILSVHAELPGAPVLKQEELYLSVLEDIAEEFPGLKIIAEHLSTAAAARWVARSPENIGATVTVHHLLYTLDDLMGGALNPYLFCKPVVKTAEDRAALRDLVFSGTPGVFFGSDSAPHPRSRKESGKASPGIFSAPAALSLLTGLFEEADTLVQMEAFVSVNGARFYGLDPNPGTVTLVKESWTVPEEIGGAVPLLAGRELEWKAVS
jgi:dihydroorotase